MMRGRWLFEGNSGAREGTSRDVRIYIISI
jgi:hypothetical protein